MGSFNNLLSFTDEYKHLFLYNHFIKENKSISYYGANSDVTFMPGFGYVESINDYNIIKIDYPRNIINIYSVKKYYWTSKQSNFSFSKEYYNVDDNNVFKNFKIGIALNEVVH